MIEKTRNLVVGFFALAAVFLAGYAANGAARWYKFHSRISSAVRQESHLDGKGVSLKDSFPAVRFDEQRNSVLVAMGGCDSCTLRSFHPDRLKHRFEQVILVFSTDRPKLSKIPKEFKVNLDPTGDFHTRVNANLTPREYFLDESMNIVSAQTGAPK